MTAWLFGKLPAHGDFVARGLDPAERQVLDDWLSGEVQAVREALAETFTYRYDAAPPWCFVAEEVSGWRGGAVAPSVDLAGRRFPIVLSGSGANMAAAVGVAEGCEELIYRAFAERWDADRTYAALSTLRPPARAERLGWWTLGNAEFEPAELDGVRPFGLLAAMLTPAEAAA